MLHTCHPERSSDIEDLLVGELFSSIFGETIPFYLVTGVSEVVYSCMTELLSLHEDGKPDSSHHLASTMLHALVSSAAWAIKSTYPPLALAITHVGAMEVCNQAPYFLIVL